jgi:amino acid permease
MKNNKEDGWDKIHKEYEYKRERKNKVIENVFTYLVYIIVFVVVNSVFGIGMFLLMAHNGDKGISLLIRSFMIISIMMVWFYILLSEIMENRINKEELKLKQKYGIK